MKTLEISEENLRKLYASATAETKTLLEDTYSKDFFAPKITDRVKNYEDAYNISGLFVPSLSDTRSYLKLVRIAHALNEGWKPDWTNDKELKYFPIFRIKDSQLKYVTEDYTINLIRIDPNLCFKNKELLRYAVTQFIDLYRDFYLKK